MAILCPQSNGYMDGQSFGGQNEGIRLNSSMPELKSVRTPLGIDPTQEAYALRRAADDWNRLERAMKIHSTLHFSRVLDCDNEYATFQATAYPDNPGADIVHFVRASMSELLDAVMNEEKLRRCCGCRKSLPETRFAANVNTPDGHCHRCKKCEARRVKRYTKKKAKLARARA